MAKRTKINHLICLVTLAIGLIIGGSVSASVSEVNTRTAPVIGHAPVVSDVTFDKMTPAVHDTVTATPTITDEDHDTPVTSLYQWQLDGKDIPKATENSYRLVPGDGNKKLTVKVTPQTSPAITEPASGAVFTSSPIIIQGLAPEALDVKIEGARRPGQVLTGSYRYYDGDNDPEDTSSTQYEWICSRDFGPETKLAQTNTYTLQGVDGGCDITFKVTPHALSGTPRIGAQVQSKKVSIPSTGIEPIIRLSNGDKSGDFNMEVDYAHLDVRSTVSHIAFFEYVSGEKYEHLYNIGEKTNNGSTVTADGRTIRLSAQSIPFASNPSNYSVSFAVIVYFNNGIMRQTYTHSKLILR
ncbi:MULTISPECIES: hypothetical protein [unclassified Providencia]|nr:MULTISPECIES: hypothetical protein [unclassified Providencia]